jgi:predicted CoA-binding protein
VSYDEEMDEREYSPSDEELTDLYHRVRTIAVVGASGDESKAAHRIPKYLQSAGYTITPVNPRGGELFGVPVLTSLAELGSAPDVVDVFRPAAETPDIARAAVEAGAKVLWLQEGIYNDEAREIAEAAGLTVIMGRCMGATHQMLGIGRVS